MNEWGASPRTPTSMILRPTNKPGLNGAVEWGGDDIVFANGIGQGGNRVLYTGRIWDGETGLHYYRTRYMSPEMGRFISTDIIGIWIDNANFGNGYSYTGNLPFDATDPLGMWRFKITACWGGCLKLDLGWSDEGPTIGAGIGVGYGVAAEIDPDEKSSAVGVGCNAKVQHGIGNAEVGVAINLGREESSVEAYSEITGYSFDETGGLDGVAGARASAEAGVRVDNGEADWFADASAEKGNPDISFGEAVSATCGVTFTPFAF